MQILGVVADCVCVGEGIIGNRYANTTLLLESRGCNNIVLLNIRRFTIGLISKREWRQSFMEEEGGPKLMFRVGRVKTTTKKRVGKWNHMCSRGYIVGSKDAKGT